MATVIKVNVHDLDSQFFNQLGRKISDDTEVEIRIPDSGSPVELFSNEDFWGIIEMLDFEKDAPDEIVATTVRKLAEMPVMNIYLFADKLSEKLFELDTRLLADEYLKNEGDDYLSVDDFLYVRCGVVALGKDFFQKILLNPAELSENFSFEDLLTIADRAYELKTGRRFDYFPVKNYETYSNKDAWK